MTATTPKTGPQPSTRFRRIVTGASLMSSNPCYLRGMATAILAWMMLAGQSVSWGEEGPVPRQTSNHASFADMHLGLFAHYMFVGKPYQWGATEWADGAVVQSLDELADNLDVEDFAATESPDGKKTFLHLFLPPKDRSFQLPVPADGRRFSSARLLDDGRKVSLLQTDTGVRLTLDPADHWDDVDTIIALE